VENRTLMTSTVDPTELLRELDARQDELLEQLEQLNQRAEALLKYCQENRVSKADRAATESA
jgi:hypothetical protein